MTFTTPLTRDGDSLVGPSRSPVQMLADQSYDDHLSVHDEATAGSLGLSGAPIEGPTHFSQFDPIGFELWGQHWFESGCISSHFSTMVVEGQQVRAHATTTGPTSASITAVRDDDATVLTGTLSIAPHPTTALEERLANRRDPGELFIVDQLSEGMVSSAPTRDINGPGNKQWGSVSVLPTAQTRRHHRTQPVVRHEGQSMGATNRAFGNVERAGQQGW